MTAALPAPQRAAFLAVIDDVASRYARDPWDLEIARARATFDGLRGQVYDDEAVFDDHMAAFLDWYTVERALPDGLTPVVADLAAALEEGRGLSPEQWAIRRALGLSHRTLLELHELTPGGMRLLDLIEGGFWRIERDAPRDGLRRGEIFEGRLIPWEGGVVLGPVCWWHPSEAAPQIRTLVREASARGLRTSKLVDRLAQMRLRHTRFRNIALARIYSLDGLKGAAGPGAAGSGANR
jgi:hypothetical protein